VNNKITAELLSDLHKGSHKAFESVFIAYFNKVKFFIKKLIRLEEEAEELTQDLFVRLWTNREAIDPLKPIDALLYTMAKNAAFNYLKHQTIHNQYIENYELCDTPSNPEEIIYAHEINLLIDMAVSQMPEQRRRIYEMSRKRGLTNEDIARQLQITKKTVENQLSLALKELRTVISSFLFIFL